MITARCLGLIAASASLLLFSGWAEANCNKGASPRCVVEQFSNAAKKTDVPVPAQKLTKPLTPSASSKTGGVATKAEQAAKAAGYKATQTATPTSPGNVADQALSTNPGGGFKASSGRLRGAAGEARMQGQHRTADELLAAARKGDEAAAAAIALQRKSQINHSWVRHKNAWTNSRKIKSPKELQTHLDDVRKSPDFNKVINKSEGRSVLGKYTNGKKGTVIIDNMSDKVNGGTAYPARNLKEEIDRLVRNG